jgi:LysR family glycine cleavage system transcriptional activator
MPRLDLFAKRFPDVDLHVETSARLADFARDDVDIAIRFGSGNYPGLHVVPLFQLRDIVVCSPKLLERGPPIRTFDDLKRHTLLHDDSFHSWSRWLSAVGAKTVNGRQGVICGDRNSMLQAAIEGQGVALASEVFAATELAAGRLVRLFPEAIPAEFAIYGVCLPRRLNDSLISGTLAWLQEQARTSTDAPAPSD